MRKEKPKMHLKKGHWGQPQCTSDENYGALFTIKKTQTYPHTAQWAKTEK